jgi:hypothetical protein
MKTKTKLNFLHHRSKVASLALFFILLAPQAAFAQATPVCDPLPEDPALLAQCNETYGTNPTGSNSPVGDVMDGPNNGVHGMATAYSPVNDTTFFATTDVQHVFGQMYRGKDMVKFGNMFRVDQGNYGGAPHVLYNSRDNNFFVAWSDERTGDNQARVYGRVYSAEGAPLGNDFPIYTESIAYFDDIAYDATNNVFIVYAQNHSRTISADGQTRSEITNLPSTPGPAVWEGGYSTTYNSHSNQYWTVYQYGTYSDLPNEDIRIMFRRMDASTRQYVGEPMQLNITNVGRNRFGSPQIEYSATDGAALVLWQEYGLDGGVLGVSGATVYDNLTVSGPYTVLSLQTYGASEFFGGAKNLKYNPFTNTFAFAGEDFNGATTYVEMTSSGVILDTTEAIPHTVGSNGNFMPGVGYNKYGFLAFTTVNYASPKFVQVNSPYSNTGSTPTTPFVRPRSNLNSSNVSQLVSQIYVWSLGVAGMAAVTMSVVGGYMIMTARGNGGQVSRGKEYLTASLIGLVLLMAAFLILNTINSDLTNFSINLDAIK